MRRILYEAFGEHLRESLYTVHSEVPNSHEARLDGLAAKVITITPRRRKQNIMELLSFISVAGNRSILFFEKITLNLKKYVEKSRTPAAIVSK